MRLLIATLITASLLAAQDAPKPAATDFEAVIIPIKTLTGDAFDRMVRLLNVFQARIAADSMMRTVIVYAPPQVAQQIQKVVAELDRPGSPAAIGRNIDVMITLIDCPAAAKPDARPMPTDLDGVVRQLRTTMQCTNPTFLESVPMRAQEGQTVEQSGVVPGVNPLLPHLTAIMQIKMQADSVGTKDGARFVRFGRVDVNVRMPIPSGSFKSGTGESNTQYQYVDSGIRTSGDFLESQKTVVGKVAGSNGSMFAVISLKVLD